MILRLISVFLLLLLDFVLIEHHHKDGKLHNDCNLCVIQQTHQQNDTTSEILEPKEVIFFIFEIEKFSEKEPASPFETFLYSRAPPYIS
ncbi:hypothetical protein Thal_1090 [Thermocrinis albus DSM 14484]|uniref:Uncharacterized protein n=1 Tax=Thermocrinis albus (strain DSM 14484 / JCM 11386 / HI 11/12) TaxID=638303 RepID=D3SLU2_THEAH|nr:hypothetical protein [Thermocrinis albus]ADC89722.1 hypothetical protein Thal_1090 [Thermocrinis albus DSM 14484]